MRPHRRAQVRNVPIDKDKSDTKRQISQSVWPLLVDTFLVIFLLTIQKGPKHFSLHVEPREHVSALSPLMRLCQKRAYITPPSMQVWRPRGTPEIDTMISGYIKSTHLWLETDLWICIKHDKKNGKIHTSPFDCLFATVASVTLYPPKQLSWGKHTVKTISPWSKASARPPFLPPFIPYWRLLPSTPTLTKLWTHRYFTLGRDLHGPFLSRP